MCRVSSHVADSTRRESFVQEGLCGGERAAVGFGVVRDARRRPVHGMGVVRREALRYIPGVAGKVGRDVLGSDVLPGAERLRGQEHDRKPAAGSRYQGRRAGGPAHMVKAKLPEA